MPVGVGVLRRRNGCATGSGIKTGSFFKEFLLFMLSMDPY